MIINDTQFIKKNGGYLIILLLTSILFSGLLHGTVYGFHLLAIIFSLCSFMSVSLFYKSTKYDSEAAFKIKLFFGSFVFATIAIFVVATVLIYIVDTPFVGLDDKIYNIQQREIAQNLMNSNSISLANFMSGSYSGYPNLGAIVMYLSNNMEWYVPRIFTVFLMSLSSLILYCSLKKLYSQRVSRLGVVLFAFTPILSLFAILQLKDYVIVFFLVIIFNSIINLFQLRNIFKNILVLIFPLLGLLFFRPAIIFTIICVLLSFGLIMRSNNIRTKIAFIVVSALVVSLIIYGWDYLSSIGLSQSFNEYLDPRYENAIGGGKTFNQESSLANSGLAAYAAAPFYVILSSFTPVPLSVLFVNPSYPSTNFEFTSSLYLYSILPFALAAIYYVLRHRKEFRMVVFFILFFFAYKIGQSTSMSIFSLRQSLPALLSLFYILPIIFTTEIPTKHYKTIFIILVVIMFFWAAIRVSLR